MSLCCDRETRMTPFQPEKMLENTRLPLMFPLGIFSGWHGVIRVSTTAQRYIRNVLFVKYNNQSINQSIRQITIRETHEWRDIEHLVTTALLTKTWKHRNRKLKNKNLRISRTTRLENHSSHVISTVSIAPHFSMFILTMCLCWHSCRQSLALWKI